MILRAVSNVLILEKNSQWSVVADDLEMVVMFYIHEIMVAKEIEMKSCKYNRDESWNVITENIRNGNIIIKARLVACWFDEQTANL